MSIDLSKLTPAPWYVGMNGNHWLVLDNPITTDSEGRIASFWKREDAEACAMARNALDVMTRRGWGASHGPDGWWVNCPMDVCLKFGVNFKLEPFPDPFTALIEADKWYRENVEGKKP